MKTENRCLGCGIKLEIGEICYHCINNGLALTEIYSTTGKTKLLGCDSKEYVIHFEGEIMEMD